MKFIAVSYCQPDLDGEVLTKEALSTLEHNTPIPMMADFQFEIGAVEESKLVGDVLVSYGEITEGHDTYTNFDEIEKISGVGIGYMRDAETMEIVRLTSISLTPKPTCPHTGIMFLRRKDA